jgi:hypothetical protein
MADPTPRIVLAARPYRRPIPGTSPACLATSRPLWSGAFQTGRLHSEGDRNGEDHGRETRRRTRRRRDGARIMWSFIKNKLILPYLDMDLK